MHPFLSQKRFKILWEINTSIEHVEDRAGCVRRAEN
jgi:hypothetical protein